MGAESVNGLAGNVKYGIMRLVKQRSFKDVTKEVVTMQGSCEMCMYYEYDEDYECYACQMNLDEDEMERFLRNQVQQCPYFRYGDEYQIVRKQM